MSDLIERLADHRTECPVEDCQRCAAYDEIEAGIEVRAALSREAERLTAELAEYEKTRLTMLHEIERLTAELADANNSFGSQTANWPGLAGRIEDLKQLSNERWRDNERLTSELKELGNKRDFCYERLCDEKARVEALEELAKFAKAIYGRASVTEGGFVQMTSEEYLHVGQFIAATEQEGE